MLLRALEIAEKTCPKGGNDGYITPRPCQCEVDGLESELKQWKARAEALERALNSKIVRESQDTPTCTTCVYYNINIGCVGDKPCYGFINWQFDQERFVTKKDVPATTADTSR